MTQQDVRRFVYRIDSDDKVTFVSPEWLEFAEENAAPELTRSQAVGRPLWDFILGSGVQHLYRLLFETVRLKKETVLLPFRCDSPDRRRFMELSISAFAGGSIELEGKLLNEETRRPVPLGLSSSPDSEEALVTMCSWCKRIKVSRDEWWEIEKAVDHMKLFDSIEAPKVTHGACPVCETVVLREVRSLKSGE